MQLKVVRELDAEFRECKYIEHEHKQVKECKEGRTHEQDRILWDVKIVHDCHQPKAKSKSLKNVRLDSEQPYQQNEVANPSPDRESFLELWF